MTDRRSPRYLVSQQRAGNLNSGPERWRAGTFYVEFVYTGTNQGETQLPIYFDGVLCQQG